MNDNQFKRLRQFYHSLLNQQRLSEKATYMDKTAFHILAIEIQQFQKDFPEMLPQFRQDEYSDEYFCNIDAVRTYLGIALGRLKIAIDEPSITPITEERDFSFINDEELKQIIKRDFSEIQRAFVGQCWKSVIILCGGAIEAILTDLLIANESQAKNSGKAPNKPDITRWDLSDLINVCVDLSLVSPGVDKLSHSLREYRNLVHPGNEIRKNLTFDAEEAKIALEVLNMVYRDLKP